MTQDKHFFVEENGTVVAQLELEHRLSNEVNDSWYEDAVWGVYFLKQPRNSSSAYRLSAAKKLVEELYG